MKNHRVGVGRFDTVDVRFAMRRELRRAGDFLVVLHPFRQGRRIDHALDSVFEIRGGYARGPLLKRTSLRR